MKKKLEKVLLEYRGEGEFDNQLGLVWYEGGLAAKNSVDHQEIPLLDFTILHQYLSEL